MHKFTGIFISREREREKLSEELMFPEFRFLPVSIPTQHMYGCLNKGQEVNG
jgi:hypothetical protein